MAQFKGFDDFSKKFEKKVKEINGEVSFEVLFNEGFMRKYTRSFDNIQDFFDKSPFTIETEEDFEKIDEAEFDKYVSENTLFGSWEKMLGKAGEEYVAKKLKF